MASKLEYQAVILLATFLELWASIAICDDLNPGGASLDNCKNDYAFAVSVGVISFVFYLALLLMDKFCSSVSEGIAGQILILIGFLLWMCCVAACTFGDPFGNCNNGYWATWLATVAAAMYVKDECKFLQGILGQAEGAAATSPMALNALGFASLIEMWAAAYICNNGTYTYGSGSSGGGGCETNMNAWGVACGCISLVLVLVVAIGGNFVPAIKDAGKYFGIFFLLWWICGILTLTMQNKSNYGIFLTPSNGFFGCWAALVFSIKYCADGWGVEVPTVNVNVDTGDGGGSSEKGGGEPTAVTGGQNSENNEEANI